MIFQSDGNLVLYKLAYANGPISSSLWSSQSVFSGAGTATFDSTNGHIILKNTAGVPYWTSSPTGSPNPVYIMQDDGNFVGYSDYISGIPLVITGGAFGSTGTAGGKKSGRSGRIG
jgi:hypothetical protein